MGAVVKILTKKWNTWGRSSPHKKAKEMGFTLGIRVVITNQEGKAKILG